MTRPAEAGYVLVADDDDDIRELLTMLLTRWGYRVNVAHDGAEALESIGREPPDLVLLDVGMPKLDGLGVVAQLRAGSATRGIPVLLLTALGQGSDVAAGLAAGADDYVRKPFQILELRARLAALLARRRDSRALEELRDAIVPRQRRPGYEEFTVSVAYRPADGALAGGDLHALVDAPGGHVIALVGDVLGHGPGAAGLAAHTRALLVTHARHDTDPGRILHLTNDALTERRGPDDFAFASAACVALHPASGTVTWALAGHPKPFLLPGNRQLATVEPGPPLGVDDHAEYRVAQGTLTTGETLLLVSDGLLEARRGSEQFADQALPGLLATTVVSSPDALLASLLSAYSRFAAGAQADDVCMMALQATPAWG